MSALFRQRFLRLGNRLSLLIIGLVILLTTGISMFVVSIMDDVLLQSMIRQGTTSLYAISGAARQSLVTRDLSALGNLVPQAEMAQNDLAYVAIIDQGHRVIAHSDPGLVGSLLPRKIGSLIDTEGALTVNRVSRQTNDYYEFTLPWQLAGQQKGEILIGLSPRSLLLARKIAHQRILFVAGLAIFLGVAAALYLTRLFVRPISRLTDGVEQLKAGSYKVWVPIVRPDELGKLTESFNGMAAELAIQRQRLNASAQELEESYHDIVQILAGALDARDNYTYGHSTRVAQLAVILGKELKLNDARLKDLEISCLLHDIGKICIPDNILNKTDQLNFQEHFLIQQHPLHGVALLELSASLSRYIPAVRYHHEWYNGKGYPEGLCGDEIPLEAQILALADAYDAMTTSRPYRQGRSASAALRAIQQFSGVQFAPDLAEKFIRALQNQRLETRDAVDEIFTTSKQKRTETCVPVEQRRLKSFKLCPVLQHQNNPVSLSVRRVTSFSRQGDTA